MTYDIAIVGSNSHIARSLINEFANTEQYNLTLYSTRRDLVEEFIAKLPLPCRNITVTNNKDLRTGHDVIINCVGIGTMLEPDADYSNYFTVLEAVDNICLKYVKYSSATHYIHFSTGEVYGTDWEHQASNSTRSSIYPNAIAKTDYYRLSKLYSEAKHRSLDRNIIDLRLFGYFSRFIPLDDGYLMSDIVSACLNNTVIRVSQADIVRDYIHPVDLWALILRCMGRKKINTAIDCRSAAPIRKEQILRFFTKKYGLRVEYLEGWFHEKPNYYSVVETSPIYHVPEFTSMDTIDMESAFLL